MKKVQCVGVVGGAVTGSDGSEGDMNLQMFTNDDTVLHVELVQRVEFFVPSLEMLSVECIEQTEEGEGWDERELPQREERDRPNKRMQAPTVVASSVRAWGWKLLKQWIPHTKINTNKPWQQLALLAF